MSSNLIFTPVQGEESKIRTLGNQPGWLYFATDTGRMFLDTDQDERVILGGSGAAIYYGNAASEDITEIDGEIPQYVYPITSVQQTGVPKVDDIILDKHDGTFYRIVKITKENFLCERLSISGTGGGGSIQGTLRPTLTILDEYLPSNIINGQTYKVRVKSAAAKDQDGNYIPTSLVLHWKMQNKLTGLYYKEDAINLENNVEKEIDFTSYLKDSTTTSITMYVSGTNHEKDSLIQTLEVTSSELKLELPIGFHSTSVFSNPNDVVLNCNVTGSVRKLLYCYFGDGNGEDEKLELLEGKGRILKENDDSNQSFKIPVNLATHGYHTVRFELYFIFKQRRKRLINFLKHTISFFVDRNRLGIGRIDLCNIHATCGILDIVAQTEPHECAICRTQSSRVACFCGDLYSHVQHVGEYLHPDSAAGAASDCAYRFGKLASEILCIVFRAHFDLIANALHYRAGHVTAVVDRAESKEISSRISAEERRTLTVKPRCCENSL